MGAKGAIKRVQLMVAAFLIAYVVVAVAGNLFAQRREYFPFFSWSLFSNVPSQRSTFELYIHQTGDQRYSPPRNFFDLPNEFRAARNRSSTVSKAAKGLGRAIQRDPDNLDRARTVFEAHLLREHNLVEYEIARVRFRPLHRLRTGELDLYRPVGRFVAKRAP
ncbi:MAG: hypothetical protein ACFB6S_06715 [Geminicoccaceae bacterium]